MQTAQSPVLYNPAFRLLKVRELNVRSNCVFTSVPQKIIFITHIGKIHSTPTAQIPKLVTKHKTDQQAWHCSVPVWGAIKQQEQYQSFSAPPFDFCIILPIFAIPH